MSFNKLIISLFFLFFSFTAWTNNYDHLEQEIDNFIFHNQPVQHSGIAIGIIKENKLVFSKYYGYRDRENKSPIDAQTIFRLASNTKPFLATSIGSLTDKGLLSFQDTIQSHLTNFELENKIPSSLATIADLLSHRVGLPRHDALWYLSDFSREELFSRLQWLEMNKNPNLGFRERRQYNNLMYMVLGLLVEKAAEKPWEHVVQEEILTPLKMRHTTLSLQDLIGVNNHAKPYTNDQLLTLEEINSIGPAGLANSNLQDMVTWIKFLLNNGINSNGKQLIKAKTLEQMYQVYSQAPIPSLGTEIKHGLGWGVTDVLGNRLVWHGGNLGGYSSLVSFMPDTNLGLVILSNQTNIFAIQYPFTAKTPNGDFKFLPIRIYERLLGRKIDNNMDIKLDIKNIDAKIFEPITSKKEKTYLKVMPPRKPIIFSGSKRFYNPGYGDLEIIETFDGSLEVLYYGNRSAISITSETDVYSVSFQMFGGKAEFPLTFQKTQTGDLASVNILFEPQVQPIEFLVEN